MSVRWIVRDFHESDIERCVQLCEDTRGLIDSTPLNLVDLISSLRAGEPAVVAMNSEVLVGFIVASVSAERAWVSAMRIDPRWRGQGLGSQLIKRIEERLMHLGVRRIEALLGPSQVGEEALINRGFRATTGLTLFAKDEPLAPQAVGILENWGGELVEDTVWTDIAGMAEVKLLIEERIVRPIQQGELARTFGLKVPSTVMLFGPPGTGKTSFARGLAGRLGWPFVELLSSKLASTENGLAAELGRALRELGQLDHVVAFIDEFDDIGASRAVNPGSQAVVNELLKSIPAFRSQPGRLLVCATNFIDRIDPAIIRPGRFDLVIPVGPPDETARASMWNTAVARTFSNGVDVDALVEATHGFTPADLFLAAERASFAGFSRTPDGATPTQVETADFVEAIRATRRSLTDADISRFASEAELHQRI
jgi:transitional endoplasmic reticulum ATPase